MHSAEDFMLEHCHLAVVGLWHCARDGGAVALSGEDAARRAGHLNTGFEVVAVSGLILEP